MLTLYHAPTSVCSQKVRVGLAVMGLGYNSRELNLQNGDQFKPDYLRLNPDAVVPTLIDGGLVVVESSLILAYLDREHNGARLMPTGPAKRMQAEHWLLRCLAIHAAINTLSFATAMRKKILAEKTQAEIEAAAAQMPDPIMGRKRTDLIMNGLLSPYVGQALMHLRRLLNDMDTELSPGPWIGGDRADIVDIALVAYVDRLDRLGFSGLWDVVAPRVGPWLRRWQETDAYAVGIAAHVPPGSAEQMRTMGAEYWTELKRLWQVTA